MPGVRTVMVAALVSPLALAACSLGESRPAAAEPATTAEPEEVLPPERFRVKAGTFRATLRWDAPAGGLDVEEYDIFRNGEFQTTVEGHVTRYVDEVSPRRKYRWEIVARAGELQSARVGVAARTKVPPRSAARLKGDFVLRLSAESHSGYAEITERARLAWSFFPRCVEGPCRRVEWQDLQRRKLRGVLKRDGARYTGTYTGYFFSKCGEARSTSEVTIDLRITEARVIGGEWRALRLTGTVTKAEAAQHGCVSARATQAVRAKLHSSSL